MIDLILVNQRLNMIAGYLTELELLAQTSFADFCDDKIKTGAAESYLRRSLEAIFDVGRHLLAKSGHLDLSTEYKAIARGLAQMNFVTPEIGSRLIEMAGYRNRLVHLYHEITDEELYSIIKNNLDDIRQFVRQIRDAVGKK
jgi:uncharacterized protein YutE (UPF0331/DUF86 family)